MEQKAMFRDVSPEEMRSVDGGWLKALWHWVTSHIGLSGKDMSGSPAVVISVKGQH